MYCSACMFCQASTVTAAFCDPFLFFFWVGSICERCPLCHCLFFLGTLVASLPHSGCVLALGSRSPWVFLARLFFWLFVTPVEVTKGWLASNGCSRSLLLSPATLHAQFTLVTTVTNRPVSLCLCCCHVHCHVSCFVACPGSRWQHLLGHGA